MPEPYATVGVPGQPMATLYRGDTLAILRQLPAQSVHCCVTSPPFWHQRDYETGTWEGGSAECDHKPSTTPTRRGLASSTLRGGKKTTGHQQEGYSTVCRHCGALRVDKQMGLELLPFCREYEFGPGCGSCWICRQVAVFMEVHRILRDDGCLIVHLGDTYAGSGIPGIPPRTLLLLPARLAAALLARGWIVRSDPIVHKLNPVPESVKNRPTRAHDYMFMLTKRPAKYVYDFVAVEQPISAKTRTVGTTPRKGRGTESTGEKLNLWTDAHGGRTYPVMRRLRTVWSSASESSNLPHFAIMAENLIARCVRFATSAYGVCAACGAPWERVVVRGTASVQRRSPGPDKHTQAVGGKGATSAMHTGLVYAYLTRGWQPTCTCRAGTVPATTLDPFAGVGSTAAASLKLGRSSVGIDLSREYLDQAVERLLKVHIPANRNDNGVFLVTKKGRPRKHLSNASKQRAYRERHRKSAAD